MLSLLITGGGVEDRQNAVLKYQNSHNFTLDGQTQSITIEQVRQFQKQLTLSKEEGSVAFILEAQNLTLPAQHALLKTIEEPQDNLQLILTADRTSSLLPTIISRCRISQLIPTLPQADPTTDQHIRQLLNTVVTSNWGQLINLAQKLSQNQSQTTLLQILNLLRKSLPQHSNSKRLQAIRLTQYCINDLSNNVNSLLALEHYLIELRSLML